MTPASLTRHVFHGLSASCCVTYPDSFFFSPSVRIRLKAGYCPARLNELWTVPRSRLAPITWRRVLTGKRLSGILTGRSWIAAYHQGALNTRMRRARLNWYFTASLCGDRASTTTTTTTFDVSSFDYQLSRILSVDVTFSRLRFINSFWIHICNVFRRFPKGNNQILKKVLE